MQQSVWIILHGIYWRCWHVSEKIIVHKVKWTGDYKNLWPDNKNKELHKLIKFFKLKEHYLGCEISIS